MLTPACGVFFWYVEVWGMFVCKWRWWEEPGRWLGRANDYSPVRGIRGNRYSSVIRCWWLRWSRGGGILGGRPPVAPTGDPIQSFRLHPFYFLPSRHFFHMWSVFVAKNNCTL